MNADQSATLRMYINDMLAVERDIFHAVSGQTTDSKVGSLPDVLALVKSIAASSEHRIKTFESITAEHEGKWGAAAKEAVATVAGALAGLYGKVRKHPVSRMLRDDHVALNLASIAYGMLYTTALAFDAEDIATPALEAVNETAAQVVRLSALIPGIVVEELAEEGPVNSEAGALGAEGIQSAWDEAAQALSEVAH